MMNKKAVSPLIATVLLIAFAVALGAIVMNWGESFVRKTQDTASTASEGRLECTLAVDFEVINAQYEENTSDENATLSVLIRNGGDEPIAEFVAQVFTNTTKGGRGVYNATPLGSLDVKTLVIPINFSWTLFDEGLVSNVTGDKSHITEIRIVPRIDTGALTGPVSCMNRYEVITKDTLLVKDNP